jgi:DNA-binding CsgD family transcriptional regulator
MHASIDIPTPRTQPPVLLGRPQAWRDIPVTGRDAALDHPLLRAVLGALNLGLMMLDSHARVLQANPAARRLCRVGAPIVLAGHALVLSSEHLQQLLAALRAAERRQWAMLVLRQGAQCLSVGVVPMAGDHGLPALAAMLVIAPPGPPSGLALQFFSQAHRLTAAESAVLSALCQGLKPGQIAAAGGVAVSTVRTQVATLREKTHADSICHLLQMVSGLPPMASAGPEPALGER